MEAQEAGQYDPKSTCDDTTEKSGEANITVVDSRLRIKKRKHKLGSCVEVHVAAKNSIKQKENEIPERKNNRVE